MRLLEGDRARGQAFWRGSKDWNIELDLRRGFWSDYARGSHREYGGTVIGLIRVVTGLDLKEARVWLYGDRQRPRPRSNRLEEKSNEEEVDKAVYSYYAASGEKVFEIHRWGGFEGTGGEDLRGLAVEDLKGLTAEDLRGLTAKDLKGLAIAELETALAGALGGLTEEISAIAKRAVEFALRMERRERKRAKEAAARREAEEQAAVTAEEDAWMEEEWIEEESMEEWEEESRGLSEGMVRSMKEWMEGSLGEWIGLDRVEELREAEAAVKESEALRAEEELRAKGLRRAKAESEALRAEWTEEELRGEWTEGEWTEEELRAEWTEGGSEVCVDGSEFVRTCLARGNGVTRLARVRCTGCYGCLAIGRCRYWWLKGRR